MFYRQRGVHSCIEQSLIRIIGSLRVERVSRSCTVVAAAWQRCGSAGAAQGTEAVRPEGELAHEGRTWGASAGGFGLRAAGEAAGGGCSEANAKGDGDGASCCGTGAKRAT